MAWLARLALACWLARLAWFAGLRLAACGLNVGNLNGDGDPENKQKKSDCLKGSKVLVLRCSIPVPVGRLPVVWHCVAASFDGTQSPATCDHVTYAVTDSRCNPCPFCFTILTSEHPELTSLRHTVQLDAFLWAHTQFKLHIHYRTIQRRCTKFMAGQYVSPQSSSTLGQMRERGQRSSSQYLDVVHWSVITFGLHVADELDHSHATRNAAKYCVLPIQESCHTERDEKLGPVCVGSSIGHCKNSCA